MPAVWGWAGLGHGPLFGEDFVAPVVCVLSLGAASSCQVSPLVDVVCLL